MDRHTLERAAARFGIQLDYYDIWGNHHIASDDTLKAVLAAFGMPSDSTEQVERDLALRDAADWSHPVGITAVVYEDDPKLTLRVPAENAGQAVSMEIRWESGEVHRHSFYLHDLEELDRATVQGRDYVAKRLPLPYPLHLGYHQLRVSWVEHTGDPPPVNAVLFGETNLIVCPRKARSVDRRVAGVNVGLYGLRSSRNWGCGDTTDLHRLADAFGPAGVAFIALNPLHSIPNRHPYNISPYLPECSLYRNFIYLDVERVPGFERNDVDWHEVEAVRATEFVEYERVGALKLAALLRAYERFHGDTAFSAFLEAEGQRLHDYATYQALWQYFHAARNDVWLWTDWPEPFRDPRSAEVTQFAVEHSHDVAFYSFLQWQLSEQFAAAHRYALDRGMEVGLYHDLALATDRFGADLWANRPFYSMGSQVGAPPDDLAPSGQAWGFPPPNREMHLADGYRLFTQSIRNSARHGGALRIDHVMRFFRLYWIPDGLSALDGAYVQDYVEDLLGILALESHRGGFIVVGEDLGTVEDRVRERLSEGAIYGYKVVVFEKTPEGKLRPPDEYPEHAAVCTSTHDLPTMAGFPLGRDIEARKAAGLLDDAAYHQQWEQRRNDIRLLEESLEAAGFAGDQLGFVLSTPCALAIVNQEDLTGETEQINLPATTWEFPNWRRKMKVAVEDLGGLARELRSRLERAGRVKQA